MRAKDDALQVNRAVSKGKKVSSDVSAAISAPNSASSIASVDTKLGSKGASGLSSQLNDMSGILFGLVEKGKSMALKAMLDAGADVHCTNEKGNTLLIEAATREDIDTLHILIQYGGRELVNARNFEGNTALHYCTERGDAITSSFLKASGADLSIKNMYGLTADQGVKLKHGGYGETLNF